MRQTLWFKYNVGFLSLIRMTEPSAPALTLTTEAIALANGELLVNFEFRGEIQSASQPKSCVFVCSLDVSASMDEKCGDGDSQEAKAFSRLDLVRHSMTTLIHSLRPGDALAVNTFSTQARELIPLTYMNADAKIRALKLIDSIQSESSTNLWAGLSMAMSVAADVDTRANVVVLVLTDGQSNTDPPRGIMYEFQKKYQQSNFRPGIHTFGYAYDINSNLLSQISEYSGGCFAHIPDFTMCNTVFINFTANAFTMIHDNLKIQRRAMHKADVKCLNFPVSPISEVINLGAIHQNQPTNALFQIQIEPDGYIDFEFGYGTECDACRWHPESSQVVSTQLSLSNFDKISDPDLMAAADAAPEMVYQFCKCLVIMVINETLTRNAITTAEIKLGQIYRLTQRLSQCQNPLLANKMYALTLNLQDEREDSGQIMKAVKPAYYMKWGRHYLAYFARSLQLQLTTNFKCGALQHFGGAKFHEERQRVEDIFAELPIPRASLKTYHGNANTYHSGCYCPDNICLHAESMITTIHGLKPICEIGCGDTIYNGGIEARVQCMVASKVAGGIIDMCRVGDLYLTPWHPVRWHGRWCYPHDLAPPQPMALTHVYNLVLDTHHIVTANGVDVICLGHGYQESVLAHDFWGTDRVVEKLKRHSGWAQGKCRINYYQAIRDASSGRVIDADFASDLS